MEERSIYQEREAQRLQDSRDELIERISWLVPQDGSRELFKSFYLTRLSSPLQKTYDILEPSFCVIAQGQKEVMLEDCYYPYDEAHYFLATLELPRASRVLAATKANPYIGLRLNLDTQLVSSVMDEMGYYALPRNPAAVRATDVSPLDANLLDAVVRLVRLQDSPNEAPMLMSMIMREIIYRLVRAGQGDRLSHFTMVDEHTSVIARAVRIIRQQFDQPLPIEQLAHELGMSLSSFHYHFKAVTDMTPLQFQKQLRLQEARRLMLNEHLDATSAAYRVGYNSPTHFNREYKSVFNVPPMRDIRQLREVANSNANEVSNRSTTS